MLHSTYRVKDAVGILDLWLQRSFGQPSRFIIIDGLDENGDGLIDGSEIETVKKAMSAEAVRQGATRINKSDCVDITEGGQVASDDRAYLFDKDTIISTTETDIPFALIHFMEDNGLIEPVK
jgi:hypothetical protein